MKTLTRHAAWLALAMVAAHGQAAGQRAGSIEGRVLLQDGSPVVGVEVHIHALGRTVTSDQEGRFRFANIPARRYAVEATDEAGGRGIASVTVPSGATARLEIRMTPLYHLDELVVSAGPGATQRSDLFQASSVLAGRDLAANVEATLGETLDGEPGVSASSFGAGASRPVIRGLGGDRVRILEGGVDTGDASNTSPDHAVSLEPGMAERIEVIRGPATLLYGASAIGGVVNVLDRRIPTEPPAGRISGHLSGTTASVADEWVGQGEVLFPTGPLVWSLGALRRESDDYAIPGFAEQAPEPGEAPPGALENSAAESTRASLGTSFVGRRGYIGVAYSGYDARYGVPGHEHQEGEPEPTEEEAPVSIDLRQRRVDAEGEVRFDAGAITNLRARVGVADYRHFELEGDEVGTDFRNDQWEGRLELGTRFGERLHGAAGLQVGRRNFAVTGEEAFTAPNHTSSVAAFAFQDIALGERLDAQAGLRFEHRSSRLDDGSAERSFDDVSTSLGLNWSASDVLGFALSAARSVKAPTPEELFSNGPHAATRTFEMGDPDLDPEVALSLDGTVRADLGRVSAEVTAFVNGFDGFLYLADQGVEADGLPVFAYTVADATFTGFESIARLELFHRGRHHVGLHGIADYVRAELDDGTPLPRIPPFRIGGGLSYDAGSVRAGFDVRHATEQTRVAPLEAPTSGYTTVDAEASYRLVRGGASHDLILRLRNLTDEEVRLHTSFLKDLAPQPGRDIRLVYRLSF